MPRQTTMSVLGLYNWDSTLFDLMVVPKGMDKNTIIGNILEETAELEVLYPNPAFMKESIGLWSKKQIDVWNHLYETTKYDYDPIANYDREETGERSNTDSSVRGGSDTHNSSGSRNSDGSSEGYEAGYDSVPSGDSDGLVKNDKRIVNSSSQDTNSDTINYGQTVDSNGSSDYHVHAHGNIGVTTTQKLISEERNIAKMNMYDIIITEFRDRFCVMVW